MDVISLIVPVYNAEMYLKKCVESIQKQTYKALELILIDDGSTDKSALICDEFALKDKRIKVIHKSNEGPVIARKRGLEVASGQFVAFADADDWLEPNMIERLYEELIKYDVDICMCGRYENTGDSQRSVYHGIPQGKYDKKSLFEHIYPSMIVNGDFFDWGIFPGLWDKLFKRTCLEEYFMDVDDQITMGDDAASVYPAILNADGIYVIGECLYHYRQTVSSMVKSKPMLNIETQKYSILYTSVLKKFEQYKNIFDLREQWLEYLLFLMVPRADSLYRDIDKLDYLFPFPDVKKGSNIVIYGMGTYGQRLYSFLKRTGFCNVLMCADRNYIELCKQGLCVNSPEEICKCDYDAIVVASSFAKARTSIYNDLISHFPKEKVHIMDVDLIKSDSTLKAFGLM